MSIALIIGLCSILIAGPVIAAKNVEQDWITYRSDKFGFEFAYPADMEFKASFDGTSASLGEVKTGVTLVWFEVWPPSECPRQPADAIARTLGIERAKIMTQADGPDGSSFCKDPVMVRESESLYGAKIYELELTCMRETYPGSHDDTDECETDESTVEMERVVTEEGKKGPTYLVDISPSLNKRILLVDPVGVDPRMSSSRDQFNPAVPRKILATMETFPIQKPPIICIEELQNQGLMIGIPSRRSTSGK
jgi:hypothetical protein